MPNFVGHILSSADECSFLVVELHWCVLASCTPKSWSFDNHLCVKLLNLSFWEITHVQTKTYHIVLPMKLTCPQNSFCGNIPLILFPSYSHPSFINLETSSIYSFFLYRGKKQNMSWERCAALDQGEFYSYPESYQLPPGELT